MVIRVVETAVTTTKPTFVGWKNNPFCLFNPTKVGFRSRCCGFNRRIALYQRDHATVRPQLLVLAGLILAVILASGGYLLASSRVYGIGFPLDDAWIHQTYARNLGQYGQWAFLLGQPSAGSTAPLWSVLLAAGYWLRMPYLAWTFLLGGLSLLGLALAGEALFRASLLTERRSLFPWAGLFLIGEWHLVWASVSGMETLLFGLCILLVLWRTGLARGRAWAGIGLLIGASAWVRPDGITLLGPAVLTLLLSEPGRRERGKSLAWLALGTALFFVPYLVFNLLVQGSLWPNTFYAKQAEYAAQRQLSLLIRFWNEIRLPLIGSGLFLLPGFLAFSVQAVRERRWAALAAVIWLLGYGLLYALRLPVTYQYGRYFMPAMPVYFVTGLAGTFQLIPRLRVGAGWFPGRISWLIARVAILSGGLVWLAFYGIGAGRYAQDVAIIQTEMVATAKWVAANTEPGALIAVHDIGAMGYFGQHRLLDLAGLVSPQVIPFIRDEDRIAGWLDQENVDYLVVLSGWYTRLPEGRQLIFQTNGRYAPASGGSNMLVYRWKP